MSNKFRYTIYIIALIDVAIEIILIEIDNVKDDKNKKIPFWIASGFNILMYITPGLNIIQVFKKKKRKLISLTGSIVSSLNCGAWLGYGIVFSGNGCQNLQIIVANGAGLFICLAQIITYWILSKKKEKNENGSQDSTKDLKELKIHGNEEKRDEDIFQNFM